MRPHRDSNAREIFKVELLDEMEGSLYGASPQPAAQNTPASVQALEARERETAHPRSPLEARERETAHQRSQDSLLGYVEVASSTQPQAMNDTSTSRPPQGQLRPRVQPLHRMPLVIRRLPPLPPTLDIPERAEEFTFRFLKANLRGASEPPCCYHIIKHTEAQLYPVAAWYAIDRSEEPFMPNNPGQHGAKLTLFMPEISNFDPTDSYPLFVKRGTRDYMYYGTYKQPRYSDRLSYAEMELEVPRSVKEHRAKELGKKGKAKWIVDAMKYQGVVETDEEAEAFGPKDILQAFQRADTDLGLRLYWEYLQCVGYDRKLYDTLVAKKREGE